MDLARLGFAIDTAALQQAAKAMQSVAQAAGGVSVSAGQAVKQSASLTAEQARLAKQLAAVAAAQANAKEAAASAAAAQNKQETSAKKLEAAAKGVEAASKRVEAATKAVEAATRKAAAADTAATTEKIKQATASQRLAAETARAQAAQARLEAMVQRSATASERAAAAAEKQVDALQDLRGAADGALAPMRALQGILMAVAGGAAIRGLMNTTMLMQRMTMTLTMATGSAATATQEIEWAKQAADRMGQEFEAIGMTFARLTAAGRNLGLTQEQVRSTFEGVTAASTAFGLAAHDTEGAINALQQMLSKGSVQAEELRGQLGERIPTAWGDAVKAMGMSNAEFTKMMESGKLNAAEFVTALTKYWKDAYGPLVSNAESASKAMGELENAYLDLKMVVIEGGFEAALMAVFGRLTEIANSDLAKSIAAGLGGAFKVLADNLDLVEAGLVGVAAVASGALVRGIMAAVGAVNTLTAALIANPLTALPALITAAVAALYYYRDATFEIGDATVRVGDVVFAVWETIRGTIQGTVQWLWNMLEALGSVIIATGHLATLDIDAAGDAWAEAGQNLTEAAGALRSAGTDIVTAWDNAIATPMEGMMAGIQGDVNDRLAQLKELNAGLAKTADVAKPAAAGTGDTAKEMEKLAKELASVRGALDPVWAATTKYEETVTTLDRALKAKLITDEEHVALLDEAGRVLGDDLTAAYGDVNTALADHVKSVRDANEELRWQIEGKGDLIPFLTAERDLREELGRDLLPEEAKRLREVHDEQVKLNKEIKAQEEAKEAAKRAAEEWAEIWQNAAEGIQRSLKDTFRNALDGNIRSFQDFGASLLNLFKDIAAEIAAMLVFRPVVGSIMSGLGIGGAGSSAGAPPAAGNGGLMSGLSGLTSAFSAGGGSLTPGLDAWAQSTFGWGQIGSTAGVVSGAGMNSAQLAMHASEFVGVGSSGAPLAASTPGLMNSGSAFGGFSSFGNMLGIAGSALSGLMSGNYAQAALGAGGAAIGTIILPGLGTAIGGMLGNIAGSLFGGQKETNVGQGTFRFGGGGVEQLRMGLNDSASAGPILETANAIQKSVSALAGAAGLPLLNSALEATIHVNEETGEVTVEAAGQVRTFKDAAAAAGWAAMQMIGDMQGLSPAMEAAAKSAGSLEEAAAMLQKLREFQSIGVTLNAVEQQAGDINQTYDKLIAAGKELGFTQERLADIEKDRARAMGLLREQVQADIDQQLAMLENAASAEVSALRQGQVQMLRSAAAVGIDLAKVEELYGQKRLNVVKDFSDQQLVALKRGTALDQALASFEQARRSIIQQVQAIGSGFEETISTFRRFREEVEQFKDSMKLDDALSVLDPREKLAEAKAIFARQYELAKAGDSDAVGRILADAKNVLSASRAVNASGTAYNADYEWVMAAVDELREAGSANIGEAEQQMLPVRRLLDLLGVADPDIASVRSLLGTIGLDPGLVDRLVRERTAVDQSQADENLQALREAYSQTLNAGRARDYGSARSWREFASQLLRLDPGNYTRESVWHDYLDLLERFPDLDRPFAKGGVFTNGIVTRPTAFPIGLMGEAGEEAIMPLSRGSDGSLGVRATASSIRVDLDAAGMQRGFGSVVDGLRDVQASMMRSSEALRRTIVAELGEQRREIARLNSRMTAIASRMDGVGAA